MPTIQAHKLSGDFNTALYQFLISVFSTSFRLM